MATAGAVLGAGLLLTGCGLDGVGGPAKEDVVGYDVKGAVTALEVKTGAGDIVVNESDRTGLRVTETLHWRGDARPETEHPVDGAKLTLGYACPDRFGFGECWVDYKVEVPRGLDVDVDTGSGRLTLRSISGTLVASTGSGDIEAGGLAVKRVVAETGSGTVDLGFSAAPDDARVETGSGDATVRLPQGAYAVTAESGAGDERIEVTDDDSAPRKVDVSTGSGDANVLKNQ
ncbi:DUF4097 family beta strand repeat-containing protein [Microtetraspora sp. NBRC 13810]|uniref:DUF4097 family beta strand repeat-containing protein n=1 Tax=Microtetraspora sp. NBRC 13810 TaxID=3030990 RepID=UPI0025555581|nr:DUF4097 family beta strand repeat-containing protein [Microtetraspora sp. NBRC 13810]